MDEGLKLTRILYFIGIPQTKWSSSHGYTRAIVYIGRGLSSINGVIPLSGQTIDPRIDSCGFLSAILHIH